MALLGILDEFRHRLRKQHGAEIDRIEAETEANVENCLAGLNRDELASLLEIVQTRRAMVDVNPAYSNEVVNISKQILSFGVAGLALAAALFRDLQNLPTGVLRLVGIIALFYLNLMLLSLFIVFIFLWQTRFRYPFLYFKRIGNTVPFFYYRSISPQTPRDVFQSAGQKLDAMRLYADDLVRFVAYFSQAVQGHVPALTPPDKTPQLAKEGLTYMLKDELKQYFLLLAYQGYVNQYEVRITNYYLYGLIGSCGAVVATFALMGLR